MFVNKFNACTRQQSVTEDVFPITPVTVDRAVGDVSCVVVCYFQAARCVCCSLAILVEMIY